MQSMKLNGEVGLNHTRMFIASHCLRLTSHKGREKSKRMKIRRKGIQIIPILYITGLLSKKLTRNNLFHNFI